MVRSMAYMIPKIAIGTVVLLAGCVLAPMNGWAQSPRVAAADPIVLQTPLTPLSQPPAPVQSASDAPVAPHRSGHVFGGDLLGIGDIGKVHIDIRPQPDPNGNATLPRDVARGRILAQVTVSHSVITPPPDMRGYLVPPNFCYMPPYFEESRLERYGHHHGVWQPLVSGVRFGWNVSAMPYKMAVQRPRQCYYHEHVFAAGDIAPHYFEPCSFNRRAALIEAAAIVGLIAIIP